MAKNIKNQKLNIKNTYQKLKKLIKKTNRNCDKAIDNFRFNEALKSIWELISFCDKYINENKPWEGGKNSFQVVSDVLIALNEISTLLTPFLPETTEKIKESVKHQKPKILFPRIIAFTK